MPTKRPDQLPEGSDFNLDDIVIIEKVQIQMQENF